MNSYPKIDLVSEISGCLFRWRGTAILSAVLAGSLSAPSVVSAAANGLGQTPAMGWNSWMVYGKSYDYKKVEAQADALCAQIPGLPAGTTLQSLGYNYLCMDSGWRDESGVDGSGFAKADATKFPNGVSDVANYVHGKGLKIGIYLTPGMLKAAYDGNYQIAKTTNPATGQPYTTQQIVVIPLTNGNTENSSGASYSYQIDFTKPGASQWIQNYADMLASWGVDYVMWDFVGPGGGNIPADDRTNMQQWFIATQATPAGSRPIWIKLSNSLSFTYASTWESVANSWRIDGDVKGTWTDISNRMSDSPQWAPFEGPGGWGDMDSLLVGAGNFYNSDTGATGPDERKTATTLWAICCSPLILGQDLTPLNSGSTLTDISLITNPEVIAVDQAGHVATPSGQTAGIWRVQNLDGSYTVAIFNTGSGSATISCNFSKDLGFSGSATVRDLWSRTDLGTFSGSFSSGSLNSHACRLIKVTPTSGGTTLNFEAESLTYTPSGATASVQTDANSSGGKWVLLSANASGQSIDFAIPSVNAGTYQVQMEWKGNNSRGTLQLSVDGTNLGPTLDQYASGQSYPTTTFGNVTFGTTGTHDIRLTVTGKNAASGGYGLSADKFILTAQSGGGQVAAPSFSPGGGTYSSAQNVTITSSTGGASIRYTTDGSAPSETAGTIYSGPVNISSGTVPLKAIAYKSGMTDSTVTNATYTISTGGGGTTVSYEAENLTYTPNGATASVQTDTNSSGGKWIELAANGTGQSISFTIPSVNAGTYQVQMEWKGNNTRGTLQLSVDGTNLGSTLDQYSSAQSYPTTPFGTVTFSSTGSHTVKLTVTGKNAASSGYGLSADKFTFAAQ